MIKKKSVPSQKKGTTTGATARVALTNDDAARRRFNQACRRLKNVNSWHEYAGAGSALFSLRDKSGRKLRRTARRGDFIRIDLPGPGTFGGRGYDWVKIEHIDYTSKEEEEVFSIRVRPSRRAGSEQREQSHFYTKDASSTFVIWRKQNIIEASEFGRNEIPNTKTKNVLDRIRNSLVAFGAMLGLSSIQWKKLVKGLLSESL